MHRRCGLRAERIETGALHCSRSTCRPSTTVIHIPGRTERDPDHFRYYQNLPLTRCCAGSVQYRSKTHRKHVPDHAGDTPPTWQHELQIIQIIHIIPIIHVVHIIQIVQIIHIIQISDRSALEALDLQPRKKTSAVNRYCRRARSCRSATDPPRMIYTL